MSLNTILPLLYLTAGTIILLLGLVIFRENIRQQINRVTALMLSFAAFGAIMDAFGMLVRPMPGAASIDLSFFHRLFLLWEFFFPSLLLFALLFPLPASIMRTRPLVSYLIFLPHTFHFLTVLVFKSHNQILNLFRFEPSGWMSNIFKPLTILVNFLIYLVSIFYEFHANFFALINLIYIIAAVIIMYLGYLHLQNAQFKHQVAFLLWGIRASVGLYAIAFLIPELIPLNIAENFAHFFTIAALLIGVVSIAWAIIKYQFLNIRLFIRRGIIFSLATGIVVGFFLVIYDQTERVAQNILGMEVPFVQVLFLLFAVFLFQPIITSIEKGLDKIFVRSASDYRKILQTLSRDIITILDLKQLKTKIITSLRDALLVQHIYLLLPGKNDQYTSGEAAAIDAEVDISFRQDGEFIQLMSSVKAPLLYDEVHIRINSQPELEELKRLRPYLLVPLIYRNYLEGILSLGERESNTAFSGEDITLLNILSNQIAIAVENSRLYQLNLDKQQMEKELALSREIQQMLLPLENPVSDRFEIAALNIPSHEVGGDYYDFYFEDENKLGIAIADISGKGFPASLLMANLQAVTRVSARQFTRPADVVHTVNQHIVRTTSVEKYATFLYGVFDCRSRKFRFTNAGHNYPVWRKADGTVQFLTQSYFIVGAYADIKYHDITIKLSQNDFLVFYTDGATEVWRSSGEEYSENRLLKVISHFNGHSAIELRDAIYDDVMSFSTDSTQFDDMTIVVLKVK